MKYEFINELNDNLINQFATLVNNVIKKTHSIGFIDGLDYNSAKEFLEEFLNEEKSAILFVFDSINLIGAGCVSGSGYLSTQHYAKISKVMVSPESQTKGIGKMIMTKLEDKTKELGFSHILVQSWDIDYIVNFYKKCGYRVCGVRPEFVKYKDKYFDSYSFYKKLI